MYQEACAATAQSTDLNSRKSQEHCLRTERQPISEQRVVVSLVGIRPIPSEIIQAINYHLHNISFQITSYRGWSNDEIIDVFGKRPVALTGELDVATTRPEVKSLSAVLVLLYPAPLPLPVAIGNGNSPNLDVNSRRKQARSVVAMPGPASALFPGLRGAHAATSSGWRPNATSTPCSSLMPCRSTKSGISVNSMELTRC